MTRAYKCQKCQKYYDKSPFWTWLSANREWELCDVCWQELRKWMNET